MTKVKFSAQLKPLHALRVCYKAKKLQFHSLSGLENLYKAFAVTVAIKSLFVCCLKLVLRQYVEFLDNNIHEVTKSPVRDLANSVTCSDLTEVSTLVNNLIVA